MKRIALLGGTSWPSTLEYYTELNQRINQKLGGSHSCPMLLYNIDYHEIKSRYADGWAEIPLLLKTEIENILALNPDGLIICNNTLHKAFDQIKNEMQIQTPVFHVIDLTQEFILKNKWNRVLLLATKFTMEDDFFKKPLMDAGIEVAIPDPEERAAIQEIQTELAKGIIKDEFISYFQTLADKYDDFDAFILACTELPLAFRNVTAKPVLINTIAVQCEKAIDFILS
ncbi:aspartate/glutamate racemase family protein [Dyadobacter psychrotolerans]|uniref:Amino acid racemase n=1 Tax=Dyadobacter psychrotolerans TaxID=2541721 RepID=A0A4R5DKD0_9BACT|nr:amino acid racemase [Dyadobacter psychrotolerans]TDE14626.1 amino acid racemase [Dyadobacter psychrotolerans]